MTYAARAVAAVLDTRGGPRHARPGVVFADLDPGKSLARPRGRLAVMCGRYAIARPRDQLTGLFRIEDGNADDVPRQDYNVAPSKIAPVVLARTAEDQTADGAPVRQLRLLRWGMVPFWAKDAKRASANARAETVHEKRSFRTAFAKRRLLVPVDGFYEWFAEAPPDGGKAIKQPYYLAPVDGEVLALAGLYETWQDPKLDDDDPDKVQTRFTIITTSASDDLGHVHDRMPMVITPDRWDAWLDNRLTDVDQIRALMAPPAAGTLEVYPISTAVNNVRNNGAHLLERLPGVETGGLAGRLGRRPLGT